MVEHQKQLRQRRQTN